MRCLRPVGFLLLLDLGLAPGAPALAQTLVDATLEVTTYASGFSLPTSFVFLPDATGTHVDLLLCEKDTGRVRLIRDQVLVATAALDLDVNDFGERGLLGIALHPSFQSNRLVYLYATISSISGDTSEISQVQDNRVLLARWNPSTLRLEFPTTILSLPATPGPNHDGGVILFGPDGKLYGVIGDLNRDGQLENFPSGPPPDDTAIMFRIMDDGTFPLDNPFHVLGGNMRKVYAYGVRNSFGLGFDPVTGVLWDTENGPNAYDEINRVTPGFNSGWEQIMGPDARDPGGIGDLWHAGGNITYSDPEFSWASVIAPTSIYFLPTGALGEHYRHDCFVGDNNTGSLYRFELTEDRTGLVMPDPSVQDLVADNLTERNLFRWGQGFGVVTDFESGPDGALYVLSLSQQRVFRIARSPTSVLGPTGIAGSVLVASPNPFRDGTALRLEGDGIAAAAMNALHIYSTAGRLVRVLPARSTAVEWDGRDAAGRPVPAGVYHVHSAQAGAGRSTVKLVRLPSAPR